MTISDAIPQLAIPQLWASSLRKPAAGKAPAVPALNVENSVEFRLGPQHTPTESMRRARGFVTKVLPALLVAPNAEAVDEGVLTVLTELIDVTARHRASTDLSGRISYDGEHVLITVGEMNRRLPDPHEEPGLFLVHRLVDGIGQYRGDGDGYATWASIPVRLKAQ